MLGPQGVTAEEGEAWGRRRGRGEIIEEEEEVEQEEEGVEERVEEGLE